MDTFKKIDIFNIFKNNSKELWLLYGNKVKKCKKCNHDFDDNVFLINIYDNKVAAENDMEKLNKKFELSFTNPKLIFNKKYYGCFIIAFNINNQINDKLESIEEKHLNTVKNNMKYKYKYNYNYNYRENQEEKKNNNYFNFIKKMFYF